MTIWDLHCHPNAPGETPARRMAHILKYADRMGVERLCVYMARPWDHHATPETFRRSNDDVLAICAAYPDRVFGFAYLNPKYVDESLAEIRRCVVDGPMVGLKLWQGWHCLKPELEPILARAAELEAAIYHHAWFKNEEPNPEASTPDDLAQLSARHPGLPLICGHTGGNWELGIRAIRRRKELYGELGGSDPTAGVVEMAVRELGAERVLYGSDVFGRSFSSQIAKVSGAAIPARDKQLIFRDNLRNLLLPILTRKGIKA